MSVESKRKRPPSTASRSDREYKMILVVNSSLKMGKGKIGMHRLAPSCCLTRQIFLPYVYVL